MGSVCMKNSVGANQHQIEVATEQKQLKNYVHSIDGSNDDNKNDDENYPGVPFTKGEITMLQKQWPSYMVDSDKNGIKVFRNIFILDKGLMAKFHFSVAYMFDIKKTLRDARLSFHVRRVNSLFEAVIESLSSNQQFDNATKQVEVVGEGHQRFGMKRENFETFKKAILMVLSDTIQEPFDEEAELIWSKFINIMISHMVVGIERAKQKYSNLTIKTEKTDLVTTIVRSEIETVSAEIIANVEQHNS